MLSPTPAELWCDRAGRPYFVWEEDLTLDELRRRLSDPDPETRRYWYGVVLRQAKPDDSIVLLGRESIRVMVPKLAGQLGRMEPFWQWLTSRWTRAVDAEGAHHAG